MHRGLHAGVVRVPGRDPSSPGVTVRSEALRRVAGLVGAPRGELSIAKEGRIPTVLRGSRRLDIDLSLSHHGRYAAWACEFPPAEGPA